MDEKNITNIKIENILPNRMQPRIVFEDESIDELAESIKKHGIINPITVRRLGNKYEIIAGERRFKIQKVRMKVLHKSGGSPLQENSCRYHLHR